MIHWSIVELLYVELLWWLRTERDVCKRHETIRIEDGLPLMQYYGARPVVTVLDHMDYICQAEVGFLRDLYQTTGCRIISSTDHCLVHQVFSLLTDHNERTSHSHGGSLTPKCLIAPYVAGLLLSGCGSITAGNVDGLFVVIVLHTVSRYLGSSSSILLVIQTLACLELDPPI